MEIYIENKTTDISNIDTESLGIGIYKNNILTSSAKEINEKSNGFLKQILDNFNATLGSSIVLYNIPNIKAKSIVIIGLGNNDKYSLEEHNIAEESLVKTCIKYQIKECYSTIALEADAKDSILFIKNSIITAKGYNYRYTSTIRNIEKTVELKKIVFMIDSNLKDIDRCLLEGTSISEGIYLAKQLGNLPSNICTPTYLANEAKKLEQEFSSIKTNILDIEDISKIGMKSFMSVAKGSLEPLKFIEITYQSNKTKEQPIIIIGKGITFDSGGISLKPSSSMEEMKYDMCGAAAVLGIMKAIARLKINHNIIGLIPACENMPSGSANKPGDVIESMSGKTIEIINTDAEGRLVLCDALTYAKKYDPCLVIDMATLTGACVVSLGSVRTALFSNDKETTDLIFSSSKKVLDYVWEMPLDNAYKEQLKSDFADIKNTGGYSAGCVTAACFLSEFVDKYKWVHLDIAGTAWDKANKKGATGRPVALITQFLLDKTNAN
ncbi:MAG: leucyl aminopeptidase [Candidatus Kinetoplastibacterium crithidii]|nr:MAG: leucyl aminopeptidase [Candidatus Kinetoplastibacterium crithidii]